jgi:hypothetical protein
VKRAEGVVCENLALVSPIAVIAASAAIENSRCKLFAQRATGFMIGLPYRTDVRHDAIKSATIVTDNCLRNKHVVGWRP